MKPEGVDVGLTLRAVLVKAVVGKELEFVASVCDTGAGLGWRSWGVVGASSSQFACFFYLLPLPVSVVRPALVPSAQNTASQVHKQEATCLYFPRAHSVHPKFTLAGANKSLLWTASLGTRFLPRIVWGSQGLHMLCDFSQWFLRGSFSVGGSRLSRLRLPSLLPSPDVSVAAGGCAGDWCPLSGQPGWRTLAVVCSCGSRGPGPLDVHAAIPYVRFYHFHRALGKRRTVFSSSQKLYSCLLSRS